MTVTFCPPLYQPVRERDKQRERKRENEKKRCAQACRYLVISHATNCQNVARALNLASDRAAEFSQMVSVVTLTPA